MRLKDEGLSGESGQRKTGQWIIQHVPLNRAFNQQ